MEHKKEFEDKLLSLLVNPCNVSILPKYIDRVTPEIMTDPNNKWVTGKLKYVFAKYGMQLDIADINYCVKDIDGGTDKDIEDKKLYMTYLLAQKPDISKLEFYLDRLCDMYNATVLIESMSTAATYIDNGEYSKSVEEVRTAFTQITKVEDKVSRGEYGRDTEKRENDLRAKQHNKELCKGILTGFNELDSLTAGLWRGELGCLTGKTGSGKSMMALHFARTAAYAEGKKVLYIVIEMPKEQLYNRIDASLTGIETKHFKFGTISDYQIDEWRSKLTGIFKRQPEGKLYVHHISGNCTIERIRQEIEYIRIYEKEEIDMLIIDDIDMMPTVRNTVEGQVENARRLKGIAIEKFIPVWFITQLRTDAYHKEYLEIEDVGWGKGKVHVSDLALALIKLTKLGEDPSYSAQLLKYREGEMASTKWILHPMLEKAMIFGGVDDPIHIGTAEDTALSLENLKGD